MNLTGANLAALADGAIHLVLFLKVVFPGGTFRVCTHDAALPNASDAGASYSPDGTLLDYPSGLREGTDGASQSVVLSLAPSATLLTRLRTDAYAYSAVTLYATLLNTQTGAQLEDPDIVWTGYLSAATEVEDESERRIDLTVEPKTIDQYHSSPLRSNSSDQTRRYAGDKGFDLVAVQASKTVEWGGRSIQGGRMRGGSAPPGSAFGLFGNVEGGEAGIYPSGGSVRGSTATAV